MIVKSLIVITLSFIIKEVLSLYSLRLDISFDKFKYHEGSTKLYSLRLDISFDELKNLVCRGNGSNWVLFDVDITWRMLGGGHPNCYVDVSIISDMSFNSLVELIIANIRALPK